MSIIEFGSFTNSTLGAFTEGINIVDNAGNQQFSGYSTSFGIPMVGGIAEVPNGLSFFISGAGDLFEMGNGGQGQPNFLLQNYEGNVGIENNYGTEELLIFGNPTIIGTYNVEEDRVNVILRVADIATTVTGPFVEATTFTPASSSAAGFTGQISWDQNYIYVCLNGSTPLWGRATLISIGW